MQRSILLPGLAFNVSCAFSLRSYSQCNTENEVIFSIHTTFVNRSHETKINTTKRDVHRPLLRHQTPKSILKGRKAVICLHKTILVRIPQAPRRPPRGLAAKEGRIPRAEQASHRILLSRLEHPHRLPLLLPFRLKGRCMRLCDSPSDLLARAHGDRPPRRDRCSLRRGSEQHAWHLHQRGARSTE